MKLDINFLNLVESCKAFNSSIFRESGFVCEITDYETEKAILIRNDNYPLWCLIFTIPKSDFNSRYIGNNTIDHFENRGTLLCKERLYKTINSFFFDDFVPVAFSIFSQKTVEFNKPDFFNILKTIKENESQFTREGLLIENLGDGMWRFANRQDTVCLLLELDDNGEFLNSIHNFIRSLIVKT